MSLKKQSLKFRLIISYSLTAFALTSCAILFLYYTLTHLAKTNDANFLQSELHTIANILMQEKKHTDLMADLEQEIILEPQTSHEQYYVRLLNQHGAILMQTPNIKDRLAQHHFPSPHITNHVSELIEYNTQQNQYSLMTLTVPYNRQIYTVQVVLNSSHTKALISKYKNYLLLLLLINIFFSILIGLLVTKYGLKPINTLNKLLHSLQSDQLHLQLKADSWPMELQQTITELNSMLTRIDTAFNRLKDFSSDIAHELRTPLNNIICQNEVTLGKARSAEEYTNTIASTIEECQKMAQLIDNMLLIARSKNPYYTLKQETLSLRSLLDDTINYLQSMAEDKNIHITVTGEALVNGDASLLKRAFINLLVNSINYSTPNQHILIAIEPNEALHTVMVTITDSGFGIDAKDLPHIFDRFYRADLSRSKNIGGTGLGLAIVKSIIELHRAEIRITSELHTGTCIQLIFKI